VDQGIFALYDTNGGEKGKSDALRKIMLTTTGTLSKTGNVPGANNLTWLLDFANEGPTDTFWVPTGGVPTDGDDRIFGDLGNDRVVGGTGRDMMFPGWGNDLVNDDNLETNGGLNNRTDTNPSYNDLVYGGSGLDVMIGNTGGDRMDDFVGEFNSFYVPYSNFGLPTVQRLPNPGLIDFLLQVAKNDGADLSLAAQYHADTDPTRNGEPFGMPHGRPTTAARAIRRPATCRTRSTRPITASRSSRSQRLLRHTRPRWRPSPRTSSTRS
jgi:hemolysin type calcium-binding protein